MTYNKEGQRKRREARIAEGICVTCGNEAMEDSYYCGRCDEIKEERLKKLQDRGKDGCRKCGKKRKEGYFHCEDHVEKNREAQRRRAESKRNGRPKYDGLRKYKRIYAMNPGDMFIHQCSVVDRKNAVKSAPSIAKVNGWKITTKQQDRGVLIWRLS